MSITPRLLRILMLAAAAAFLAVALLIRAVAGGGLEQHSGTALYASMVWAGVLFLWPRIAPLPAGAIAIGFCWVVELSQLTGIPAALSARSLLARLVLGVQFDPLDLACYPVGVLPLVALHQLIRARTRPSAHDGSAHDGPAPTGGVAARGPAHDEPAHDEPAPTGGEGTHAS